MEDEFICKIANLHEMNIKWDYQISISNNKSNWKIWKFENIERFKKGQIIPYYELLNGKIICEATAILASNIIQNSKDLVGNGAIYLSGFRTNKEYRGKGYFSKLFKYMINDLKEKGYIQAIVGVEPKELINKEIYNHYGFTEYIKTSSELYPDGTKIEVEYYGKVM